jgi:hypothetical protein
MSQSIRAGCASPTERLRVCAGDRRRNLRATKEETMATKPTPVGSPYPIDNGAGTRTLWRRIAYGGRKGRRARRRLLALEKRIAPYVHAELARMHRNTMAMLKPVMRFAGLR